ncbi:MAG: family transcriptional regulator, anaerobic regulatory protein [Sphaerochaeta sp.]|uniref:Crp/Fnr family transcriptional regulator n=1 Tax=Sphaerochaeta halotolerans TaxID=2293840 RepID=A0A372MJF8_9SPIR|nr:Crp/Fnr family transcriptional regulator [Sphaerochaeta halotolerans]MDK2859428.1 family transcriptional regulator, anaerobic regulatory protein [Sphaerochaeta sp.]RFU95911.1 Crp/Fnr family transcriptional regulator [Sphaerochaeta halotolerans]
MDIHQCSICANGSEPCLQHVPLFQNLESDQIQEVQRLIRQIEVAPGAVLFREGDNADSLYLIRKGSLKLVRYGSDGSEYILDTLFPGDFYGGDQLFLSSVARETGVATEPLGICMIKAKELQHLILQKPAIALKTMTYLNAKLDQYRLQVEMLSTSDVQKRICMYLIERYRKTGSTSLHLTQDDIGSALHLTKETVNRKLSSLKEEGILRVEGKGKLLILDMAKLEAISFES